MANLEGRTKRQLTQRRVVKQETGLDTNLETCNVLSVDVRSGNQRVLLW